MLKFGTASSTLPLASTWANPRGEKSPAPRPPSVSALPAALAVLALSALAALGTVPRLDSRTSAPVAPSSLRSELATLPVRMSVLRTSLLRMSAVRTLLFLSSRLSIEPGGYAVRDAPERDEQGDAGNDRRWRQPVAEAFHESPLRLTCPPSVRCSALSTLGSCRAWTRPSSGLRSGAGTSATRCRGTGCASIASSCARRAFARWPVQGNVLEALRTGRLEVGEDTLFEPNVWLTIAPNGARARSGRAAS